jgi:hypothetical protein
MLYFSHATLEQLNARGHGFLPGLPDGATNFTTIELKSNFLGTTREGAITCLTTRLHGGRTTQLWDADVKDEVSRKTIALFRCTQLILYPRQPFGEADEHVARYKNYVRGYKKSDPFKGVALC